MNVVIFTDLYFIPRIAEIFGLSDFLKGPINVIYNVDVWNALFYYLKDEYLYIYYRNSVLDSGC